MNLGPGGMQRLLNVHWGLQLGKCTMEPSNQHKHCRRAPVCGSKSTCLSGPCKLLHKPQTQAQLELLADSMSMWQAAGG